MLAMGCSLNYFDMYRTANLPLNLTQAQRDFFGSHTYERTDKPGRAPCTPSGKPFWRNSEHRHRKPAAPRHPAGAHGRSLHRRHLRRVRRPHQAQARAGALPAGRSSASCPPSSRSSARRARRMTDDAFRDKMKQSVAAVLGREEGRRRRSGARSRKGLYYLPSDIGKSDDYKKLSRPPRSHRPRARHRRQPPVLSFGRAALLRARRSSSWARRGSRKAKPGSWVRVIIEKPFGSDLDERAAC